MVVETLGCNIRTNQSIKGIVIEGVKEKGVQYADDLWLFLLWEKESINAALVELEEFWQFSGLKTNYEKSCIIRMGPIANTQRTLDIVEKLAWSAEPIKILGIYIHPDIDVMIELNYTPLLRKIRDIITMWKYRTMSVLGKTQIINSLIASQLVHRMMCLPSRPDTFSHNIRK